MKGSILYADDVAFIGENEKMFQDMLNTVRAYGSEFSLSFNIVKPENGVEDFVLGNQIIKSIKEYKYLGVLFEEGVTGKAKSEGIFRFLTSMLNS